MKVSDLLVENISKTQTGYRSVDDIIGQFSNIDTYHQEDLPVSVSSSNWETLENPERIFKRFSFSSVEKQKYFINELMMYQERINHHAVITISGKEISIESYTHDVGSVTSQDLKLAKFADEAYEDTRYFSR